MTGVTEDIANMRADELGRNRRNRGGEGIGDLDSKERGTAARFNNDKTKLQYIPMRLLIQFAKQQYDVSASMLQLAHEIANFEEGEDAAIYRALAGFDLKEVCEVFDFGANKYAAWNWAKGFPWSSVLACFKRHWLAAVSGEDMDPESGRLHTGHAGCNVVMLAHFINHWREGDDRPDASLFALPQRYGEAVIEEVAGLQGA